MSRLLCCRLLIGAAGVLPAAAPAEFSGYLVLTSDYVYRGVTYSDGHAAAQLGLDWTFGPGFYAGAWASTVDIYNGPGRTRDKELSYYLGYGHPLNEQWTLGANVVAYTFPGTTGNFDYDYRELTLSISWADRAWLEYSYTDDLYHSGRHASNWLLYGERPGAWGTFIGAGVGYYDSSPLTGIGYGYWQFGLSKAFGPIDLDLRFHDTNRSVFIVSSPERAGSRVSLGARLQF